MTKKEIDKSLANTKVYVNGKSKEIQEKLFSFGFYWFVNVRVSHTEKPFLYLTEGKEIKYGDDMKCFTEHEYREISAEEILSLKLTESTTYRPFRTQEECWQEMLKHQPFGWIKRPYGELFCIDKVLNNRIEFCRTSCKFEGCIDLKFTFPDGTPFGIKEI